jgi:osmoprotectant transport system substrate-binding protein
MRSGRTWLWGGMAALALAALAVAGCRPRRSETVVVGSKNFPEQALLGEIVAEHIEARTHLRVERRFYLAGSFICQQALLAGRIDTYVEYTGTALTAILHDPIESDSARVLAKVRQEYRERFGLEVMPPLGFNNTFALVIRGADARRLGIGTLSQAVPYASDWRAGFGYEFLERPDGYAGMAKAYGLHFHSTRVLDLGLLYRALVEKQVDIVAGNSTDGILAARDLTVLDDDKHYFPPYQAVPVIRDDTLARYPELRQVIGELAGRISDAEMQKLNYAVSGQGRDVIEVAHEFLRGAGLD